MWENTALIIVDVQYGLFTRETPIYKAQTLLENLNKILGDARASDIPIFFIQHCSPRLKEGSVEWQLHPSLQVEEKDSRIIKDKPNAFIQTSLKKNLDGQGIRRLVIGGIWTHNCVQATCKGGKRLGYEVILILDGHSRDGTEYQAKNSINSWNRILAKAGVTLLSTDDIDFSNKRTAENL